MVWWFGPCAAWGCCASLSCQGQATSIYELEDLVSSGEGIDGHQVYRAANRDTGEIVALKVLPRCFLRQSEQRRHMRREVQVLSKLNHPNLVRLFGVYESENTVEIAFELAQGGQVMRRILEPHASIFILSEAELSRAFGDIIQGVCHLHERGWIHGDVRPEHILYSEIDANSKAILVDFGRSGPPATFEQDVPNAPNDLRYLPPFLRHVSLPFKFHSFLQAMQVDLYALGVCLYTMLFAQFPDPELSFPVEFPHVSRAARDLLTRLLTSDERKWSRSSEIAEHPWLKQPSVAPRHRWSPCILAMHEQFVHQYANEPTDRSSSSQSQRGGSESRPRPSWISTDGALVLDSNPIQSADAYIHQADMDMADTIRRSEDIPLSLEDKEAAEKERGWRLMWKGLGLKQKPRVPGVYSPIQSP